MITRTLATQVEQDLSAKMVLLSGPRQSGKTTLARGLLSRAHPRSRDRYLNWDDDETRSRILHREFPREGLVVFDELHKFTRWPNFLKGAWDAHRGIIGEGNSGHLYRHRTAQLR